MTKVRQKALKERLEYIAGKMLPQRLNFLFLSLLYPKRCLCFISKNLVNEASMERAEHISDKTGKCPHDRRAGRNKEALRSKEMRPEKSGGQKTKSLQELELGQW